MPILNAYAGDVYWVDSGAGNNNNRGTERRPVATIDAAVSLCTASNGDIIMVKPGHAENIADATTFQIDKAGIAVVGMGTGALRPTFTFTATAGSIEMDSASCLLQNLRFVSSISAVVVGVNVDADDCAIVGCEFDFDTTGDDFLIYVDCEGVERTTIEGCQFIAEAAAGSNEAIRLDNADYAKIVGNYFFGDFANAAIWSDTTNDTGDGSTVSAGILIANNDIYNADTANATGIDLNNADTGVIAYNNLGALGSTAVSTLDPGSCLCFENYGVTGINTHAIVVPTTADT